MHNQMLLKEMMLLPPGASLVCAVWKDHYFLKQNSFQTKVRKILAVHPANLIIINRKAYFTFRLTVLSIPTKDVFENGTLLHQDEVIKSCTKQHGSGLNCETDTGKDMLIKFHHLVDHPREIMFLEQSTCK